MNIASLILAAGKGTHTKSKLPKVHKVGGKAMVNAFWKPFNLSVQIVMLLSLALVVMQYKLLRESR